MSCNITRNSAGEIQKILDKNGVESQLYKNIAKHPLIGSTEKALEVYKNSYTKKFADLEESEINFTHEVDGKNYDSFKDALAAAQENSAIKIGFQIGNKFTELLSTTKNTDLSNEIGFLQTGILNGNIAESRVKIGNEYKLAAEGKSQSRKVASLELLKTLAAPNLGSQSIIADNTTFTIKKTLGVNTFYENGNPVEVNDTEFNALSDDEIRSRFDNADQIISERVYKQSIPVTRGKELVVAPIIKTEDDIKMSLLNLLKKMGVNVVSMTNYLEKNAHKNGVSIEAEALADIPNQLIAIIEGQDTIANLREETIHFIVEAIPQERLENILRNIHKTEEYKQFAQIYREIYRDEYSAEELENAVNKEILGKIALNAVQQNEAVSEQTQNFFDNALRVISEFFQDIVNYFKPQYAQELNTILEEIQNVISLEDVSGLDLSNFASSNMRLYSIKPNSTAEGQLYKANKLLLDSLLEQEKAVRNTGIKNASNLAKLERIQANLTDVIQIDSVSGLVMVAKARIAEIKAAIKDSKQNNAKSLLTVEEKVIFDGLTKNIQPELSVIKALIKDNKKAKVWEELGDMIDNVVLEIVDISAEAKTIDNQNTERLLEDLIDIHGVQNPELMRRWLSRVETDTNYLLTTFGQVSAARDSMLNLMGLVTKNMSNEGQAEFMDKTKALQKVMAENDVTAQDFAKLVDRGFIISSYDFPKFRLEMDKLFLAKYREYSNSTLTDEEILELRRNKELETFGDKQMQYERELKQQQDKLKERAFTDNYYEEYEAKMLKANISKVTKDYLSGYFSGLADIKVKSTRTSIINGKETVVNDQSILSAADRERLKELQQDRRMVKSYYDTNGNLKLGLAIKQEDGVNVLDDNGKITYELLDNPTMDAVVAFELNKLDSLNDFKGMDMEKGIPQKFINELRNIENTFGKEEAIDFLQMNSYTGFKSEFWDGLGKSKRVTEKLREALKNDPKNEEIKTILENIETKNTVVKNILKVFVNKNSPIEIDVDRIPNDARDRIKVLQEGLETDFQNAKKYTKDIADTSDETGLQPIEEAVSSANQAWFNLLEDSNIVLSPEGNPVAVAPEILKLAKQHMTSNNIDAVESADINVRQYRSGKSTKLSKSVKAELEKQGLTEADLKNNFIYAKFITTYAENRLLPYYRRFAPASYSNFNEDLQESENVTDFVLNISDNYPSLEITPNASYFDVQDNKNVNPNFDTNFKGGFSQPNKKDFKNQAFYDLFGDDKGTKNPKLFKVYQAMMDYRMDSLEANSAGRSYNAYLLPQTRKGKVERFTTFLKSNPTQSTKNAIQDMFNFTEDEQVKGDVSFNSTIKTIPKMYLSEIEPTDVSTELFYSLMLTGKEAYSRKSKIKHYGDVMSILDTMQGRDYSATGKVADATNTMKMVKSAVDYSLFGIKENSTAPLKTPFGTVDVAKVARNLLGYVKLKNLGFNAVIPFTSYATAKLNVWTESLISQYLHKRSHKLGQAEYGRKWTDGMQEMGKVDTKADINVYLQHFRSLDLDESFKNSNYGFLGRNLPKTGMALHSFANYPIYGVNLYSVLHDFRFVGGKLMNFSQFRQQEKQNGVDKKDYENAWNALEDKVIYKYTKNDAGQFKYLEKEVAQELGISEEAVKEEIIKLNNTVTNYLRTVNEFVDGSISPESKTLAQRDAYLSYLTTHKGWLTVATQRRFKSRHINLETGQEEEGSYQSAWNFLGDYIREYKDSGASGFITNFKKAWNKADDVERANLIRVTKELAVLNSVVALLMLLKSFSDEPENEDVYSLQLATYLMYRISSETTSSSIGLGGNYSEALKSPLIGYDTVSNLSNVVDLVPFVGDDEVTQGKYRGMTERSKFIITSFPGAKSVFDLYNINSTLDTYQLFNEKNLNYTVGSSLLWAESEEDKNENN
jgi:hypothetical protein